MDYSKQLDQLYGLTQVEQQRILTTNEAARYTELYDTLVGSEVPIEFPVNI